MARTSAECGSDLKEGSGEHDVAGGPVVQQVEAAGYVPTRYYQARKALGHPLPD